MRERFEKLHDILYAHYNGVLITLLACVMVIGTAIVITIQPMQTLISCQNIINEVGEDKVAGYQNQQVLLICLIIKKKRPIRTQMSIKKNSLKLIG